MLQIKTLSKSFIKNEINEYLVLEFDNKSQSLIDIYAIEDLAEALYYKYRVEIEILINKYHLKSIETLKARFNKLDELIIEIIESLKIIALHKKNPQ